MKTKVTLLLDEDVAEALERRAKKNLFTLQEQIDDILRRSIISSKKKPESMGKVEDKFLEYFSRHASGRKSKKKKGSTQEEPLFPQDEKYTPARVKKILKAIRAMDKSR
jgi:hypothetical protein